MDILEDKGNVRETEPSVSTFLSLLFVELTLLLVEMSVSTYGRFSSDETTITCSVLVFAPFGLLLRRAITELLTKDENSIPLLDVLLVNMIAR